MAYCGDKSLVRWAMENPYALPLGRLQVEESSPDERPAAGGNTAAAPPALRLGKATFAWVPLADSLQWRYFRRTVEVLRQRGNQVFVVVGPFNEHMLTEKSRGVYADRLREVVAWLSDPEQGVPHHVAELLPATEFADASHPIGIGYSRTARELQDDPAFRGF